MSVFFLKKITKERQISKYIWKCELNLGLLIISIWLVRQENSVFIIDTGVDKMWQLAYDRAHQKGNLQAVFLTHWLSDYAGGINQINNYDSDLEVFLNNKD